MKEKLETASRKTKSKSDKNYYSDRRTKMPSIGGTVNPQTGEFIDSKKMQTILNNLEKFSREINGV